MTFKEILRSLNKTFKSLEKAENKWNFNDYDKYSDNLRKIGQDLLQTLEIYLSQLENDMKNNRKQVEGELYQTNLKDSISEKLPIEIKGSFPNYTIGPFKLVIDVPQNVITFRFSRKAKKIAFFEPKSVAKTIGMHYQKIVKRSFNAKRFAKDLRTAYTYCNRLAFQKKEVTLGHGVSLKEVYKLLTLSRMSKSEYPEEQYIYDLSKFRQSELCFDGYRFELGPSREIRNTYLLIDPDTNREIRVGSLIVYKEDLNANKPE